MFGLSMNRGMVVVALGACLVASACSSKHPAASPAKGATSSSKAAVQNVATVTVTVQSSGFSPASVSLSPGTNVVWIQDDADAKASHTVVSGTPGHPDSKFSSIALKKGASFTIAPQVPGAYTYYDGLHSSFTGTFAVSGPAKSGSPSPASST